LKLSVSLESGVIIDSYGWIRFVCCGSCAILRAGLLPIFCFVVSNTYSYGLFMFWLGRHALV